jgi:alpha-glucosidase
MLAALTALGMEAAGVESPDRAVKLTFAVKDGAPSYAVRVRGRAMIEPSALALVLEDALEGAIALRATARQSVRSSWKPLYGERSSIPDCYNGLTVALQEQGPRARRFSIEFRVYDEGVAFRYVFPKQDWSIREELTEFRFPAGASAFPIYSTEGTFAPAPVPLAAVKNNAHPPLTVAAPAGFASVLEANAVNYSRMRFGKTADGALVTHLLGPVRNQVAFNSPWRVILLGASEAQLVEREYLSLNLNPPDSIADKTWIVPGKTISNEGNAELQMAVLKKMIDFAAPNGFKYLQLDWGWYGTEWAWTDQERATALKTMPELASDPTWEANTHADPARVAHGTVPYRPDWKSATHVDLDMPALIRYAKARGMGICLYVEAGKTLRAQNLDKLFATYEQWGVAGLKPGFVHYGTQENTNWIRQMVETAARHRLWLCIHDEHLPDGMERTYPNVFIVEGGGGQEGNHPASHDVVLPFTRGLAGPFDYTPGLYTEGKSHAHMLAFYVVLYGPSHTLRNGYLAWNEISGPGRGGEELEFLRRVPVTWDETRVVRAKIGREVVVARRSGASWFLGGMSGDEALRADVPLGFLAPGRSYRATIFGDDAAAARDGWCPARRAVRTVTSADKLEVAMEKAGGVAVIFDPVE